MIANDFLGFIAAIPDAEERRLYPGDEFKRLVDVRNGIMHGHPGTVSGSGEQRLLRAGKAWTLDEVNRAADEFAVCALALNNLIHGPQQVP